MRMGIEEKLRASIEVVLDDFVRAGTLMPEVRATLFSVERPKRAEHGDLATNVAMTLAKRVGRPPRELAASIAEKLRGAGVVDAADVAGPGFLHVRVAPLPFQDIVPPV